MGGNRSPSVTGPRGVAQSNVEGEGPRTRSKTPPSRSHVKTKMGPEGDGTPTPFKSALMQVMMCVIANTALLSSGMTLGFTAVSLPYMEHPNDLLYIDKNESSWIASCAALAIPIGCLLSGPMMDRLGRRSALMLSCLPAFAGWLCMALLHPGFWVVVAGRLLTGLATGVSSTPATVFVAEAADSSIRGFLLAGTSISISLGITLVYLMGLILKSDWRSVCIVCGVTPVLGFLTILLWLPESPQWLAIRGRTGEAARALAKVRAEPQSSEAVAREVREMARKAPAPGIAQPAAFKAFALPETYKPFIIMNVFFLFQQLTGIFVVIFYAVDVVKEAGVSMDPFVVTVLIGLTRLVFTVIGGLMSRKWGRRPCSLISGAGMAASLILLAGHLYLQTPTEPTIFEDPSNVLNVTNNSSISPLSPPNTSIIPVISILVYILTSTVGFLTLPWSMLGEVFPSQVRGLASGLTTCITYLVSSVTVKLYPTMLIAFNKHGVFFFYGLMAVLGTVFVAIFLPETQGKSLAQVEQYFAGKSRRKPTEEEEESLNMTKMVTIVPSSNKAPAEV